jgi:rieske iron-sulfur protein
VKDEGEAGRSLSRRQLLATGMGVGFGIGGVSLLVAIGGLVPRIKRTPANLPVQKGDFLVFASGPNQGQAVTPDDVPEDGPQVLAWPMEPTNQVVRDQNHLNILLLIRASDESWFSAAEAPHTVARVAAYSATCTHLCCSVSQWIPRPFDIDPHGYLFCPCHKTHYDPWDGAKVLAGPAPRPLPVLPLALSGTHLVAAGGFLTPPGCSKA